MSYINYVTHHGRVYPTGIRGECVEFVRRWLILHNDILFENVEHAIDIWNIPSVIRLSDQRVHTPFSTGQHTLSERQRVLPFYSIPNDGQSLPTIGSLLIYRKVKNKLPHGHVAVVIGVDKKKRLVYIDERNRRDHSKIIPILENGRLGDPDMIGWKTLL